MMELSEKKELVLQSFSKSFDKGMAYKKVGLTDSEIELLEKDEEFQQRLELRLIREREDLIDKMRGFTVSENEQIAFKAVTELGKILYPDQFSKLTTPANPVQVNINNGTNIPPEEEERVKEEYGILVGDPNTFKGDKAKAH